MINKAYTIIPALTVSSVLGTIGRPASSFRAATFTDQRIVTMLMNAELFAMCRPTQILASYLNGIDGQKDREFIPLSEALR